LGTHVWGNRKKHFGVWYKEKCNKNGERYLVAMMPPHVKGIIKTYDSHMREEVKEYDTLGSPSKSTKTFKGEVHEPGDVSKKMLAK
jgi:hypothetical protein